MGRSPCCSKDGLKKGAWTAVEDKILTDYIKIHGEGKWSNVAKKTGLRRCGKSCRLRWMNYLRPDIKRGNISLDEEELIIRLHKLLGNRWSLIAGRLPGRTDNEIKNYWNTYLAKKATDLSVHSNNEKKAKIRHPHEHEQEPEHEPKPASNTAKYKANSLPGTNNVFDATEEYKGQSSKNIINNNVDQVLPPYVEGNWQKHTSYETDQSSNLSLSLISREENSSDFMVDFNMDDFCMILDSDFTKLNEEADGDGDDIDINNGCKNEASPNFGVKMKEKYWSSSGSEGVVQGDMSSEFLSLASSFLSAAEDWPGDNFKIAYAHAHVQY